MRSVVRRKGRGWTSEMTVALAGVVFAVGYGI